MLLNRYYHHMDTVLLGKDWEPEMVSYPEEWTMIGCEKLCVMAGFHTAALFP